MPPLDEEFDKPKYPPPTEKQKRGEQEEPKEKEQPKEKEEQKDESDD